ncbi:hypothetical protein BH09BAC6_BH09BAC6_20380 [soil metagenome]|jgi:hypothetical protein
MIKKTYLFLIFIVVTTGFSRAQSPQQLQQSNTYEPAQPFLFTANTLSPLTRGWSLSFTGGYGEHAVNPLGFNGLDQHFSMKGYLGARLTLLASLGMGFSTGGGVHTLQQAEVIRDFIGGFTPLGFRLGAGLGARHEFNNDNVVFSRITAAYDLRLWKVGANLRLEKVFTENRDGVDVIASVGVHRHLAGQLFGGIEAIGQDIEGFWQPNESEGGARLLVGPSLNYAPAGSRLSFSACGGPIIYATHSSVSAGQFAARDLPASTGFTMKFNIGFRF